MTSNVLILEKEIPLELEGIQIGKAKVQVFEGEKIMASYTDTSPAGTRTAHADIDCLADVRFLRHQFVNASCDSDTVAGLPELPGFLDAGESADLDIYIANYEDTNMHDTVVTVTCDNLNVTLYPASPVPVGTLVRTNGSNTTSYHRQTVPPAMRYNKYSPVLQRTWHVQLSHKGSA